MNRYDDDPIIPTDLIAGGSLAGWALVLSRPLDTFATSKSFDGMAGLAPESMWTVAASVICALYLIGITLGGWWRVAATAMAALWWWLVGGSFLASNLQSTGTWTYLALAAGLSLATARAMNRVVSPRRQERR